MGLYVRVVSVALLVLSYFATTAAANPWNGKVVLQAYWWDCVNEIYKTDNDGTGGWYTYLAKLCPRLRDMGFDGIWVPPPCKAANGRNGMGFDLYDHYDIGQKHQHGTTSTRFGNQDELLRLVAVAHACGLEVYFDIVLNHLTGGDFDPGAPIVLKDPMHPEWGTITRHKKFQYAGFQGDGRWPKGHLDFHSNPDHGYKDSDEWIKEMFGPDVCYRGRCSEHQVQEGTSYMRSNGRAWLVWLKKQADIDGFRFDAVKHFPPQVVEDLLFNAMDDGKPEADQRRYFAVGEFVVGKNEQGRIDGFAADTKNRCGAFDFAFREALLDMVGAKGFFDMGSLPNFQQSNRFKTCPFVNNHDTWRGLFSDSSHNGASDHTGSLKNNDELLSTIDPDQDWSNVAHAAVMAVDGSPVIFYEDLFVNNQASRKQANPATHPARPFVTNLVWCHQKLNFKDGAYKVRFQGSQDLLVIERSGKAVIGLNDNGAAAQSTTIATDFGPNVTLHDYSGSTNTDLVTDGSGRLSVTVPPKTYCVWGPTGIGGGFVGHPRRTTQEFQMADDLGDSSSQSLGYGGRLTPSAFRTGGAIWLAAGSNATVSVYADQSRSVEIRVLRPDGSGAKSSNQGNHTGHGTAGPNTPAVLNFSAAKEGYHQLTAKLSNAGDTPVRAYIKVEYEAPATTNKF